jgi:hypothetical protein
VLAVRPVRWTGAARTVDYQACEKRAGEDGDEELKRPDGAATRKLDHVPGDGSKAGYLRGQGPRPDPDARLPLVGPVTDDRAQVTAAAAAPSRTGPRAAPGSASALALTAHIPAAPMNHEFDSI